MRKHTPAALLSSEPDASVLEKLGSFDRLSVAAAMAIAGLNLGGWFLSSLYHGLFRGLFRGLFSGLFSTWHLMPFELSLIVLVAALSLRMSGPRSSSGSYRLGMLLALAVTLLSAGILAAILTHLAAGGDAPVSFRLSFLISTGISPQSAGGFALLGLTMMVRKAQKRAASAAADFVTVALFMTVLLLVSGHLIATLPVFGQTEQVSTSLQSMACLLLLAVATIFRRANYGVLSILLGRGMGSKIARTLSPILIVAPYLREAGRARFVEPIRIPAHYPTAILVSLNVLVILILLFLVARRMNHLEGEISELSLRDGLTGLYNIRGFRLLASQALRMAHRSGQPFSVLFVDLDDLKKINDLQGHQAGSEFLIETGEILKNAFRETDVVGRIGGDEFAVAGQFSESAIAHAALRLGKAAELRNSDREQKFGLRFSIGHVTKDGPWQMTLEEMLAKADEAMYENKRERKALAAKALVV